MDEPKTRRETKKIKEKGIYTAKHVRIVQTLKESRAKNNGINSQ
jgi:hypothetical protein